MNRPRHYCGDCLHIAYHGRYGCQEDEWYPTADGAEREPCGCQAKRHWSLAEIVGAFADWLDRLRRRIARDPEEPLFF